MIRSAISSRSVSISISANWWRRKSFRDSGRSARWPSNRCGGPCRLGLALPTDGSRQTVSGMSLSMFCQAFKVFCVGLIVLDHQFPFVLRLGRNNFGWLGIFGGSSPALPIRASDFRSFPVRSAPEAPEWATEESPSTGSSSERVFALKLSGFQSERQSHIKPPISKRGTFSSTPSNSTTLESKMAGLTFNFLQIRNINCSIGHLERVSTVLAPHRSALLEVSPSHHF